MHESDLRTEAAGIRMMLADDINDEDTADQLVATRLRRLIERHVEGATADLLEACLKLANLAEVVGHCAGPWPQDYPPLARKLAREARAAIAKAEPEAVEDTPCNPTP